MHFKKCLPFIFIMALISIAMPAQARIDIVPQKIVVSPRERSTEVTVLNQSNESSTYRVDTISYLQNENGAYEKTESPPFPPFDPAAHVRYSPRQFTLPPGGRQKIRISLRKPADLPDGEYRFHLKTLRFGAPPAETENSTEEESQKVALTMNMGVTVPIIVRHGEVFGNAHMSDIKLIDASRSETGHPQLQTTISREGNKSAMCIIKALWTPQGGAEREIGFVRNVNLFPEISARTMNVNLKEAPTGNGTLRIELLNEETLELFDEAILR